MTWAEFFIICLVLVIISFLIYGIVQDLENKASKKEPKTINDYWESYKATAKEMPNTTFVYKEKKPVLKPNVKITSAANVETIYDLLQDLKRYDAYKKDMDKFLETGEGRLRFYFELINDKKGTRVTYSINELSEDLGGALLAAIDDHFEAMRKSISRYVDGV